MTAQTAWNMRGDVMEACSCEATCPCNFGSSPTRIPCDAVVGWHIESGTYGDTRLDDLNVVLYLRIPGDLFAGDWTVGVYFDQRANPEQLDALGSIFSGHAGGWPASLTAMITHPLAPKQVPIDFERLAGNCRVSVPGLLEIETQRVPNPMPGQPPLDPEVSGLAVPFYTGPARVRRSGILKLSDTDLSFEYSGLSALIGRFDYCGP